MSRSDVTASPISNSSSASTRSGQDLKTAHWIMRAINRERTGGRTYFHPTHLSSEQYNLLANVICLLKQKNYTEAEKHLSMVGLPLLNGQETVFKLHARMIVESYEQQTRVVKGGSFFTASSSGSKKYIKQLKKYLENGKFDDMHHEHRSKAFNDMLTNTDSAGRRLSGILEEFGAMECKTPMSMNSVQLK